MNEPLKLTLEFLLLTFSSLVYIVTIIVLLLRKNKTGLIKSYIAIVSICLYWSIGEILVILFYHYNKPYLNIVISAKYMASYTLGPLWLVFSLYYTGHRFIKNGSNKKIAVFVSLPNIPAAVLSILNFNGIFSYMVDGLVHYSYGFWIYMFLQLCYIGLGTVFMIKYTIKSSPLIRKRTTMITLGYILSILITVFYYAFNIHYKMSNMDIVPSALVVSLVFCVIASFKYSFLNTFPIALKDIVQNMNEGILIVDSEGKIVFTNKSASSILHGFDKLSDFNNPCGFFDVNELVNYIRINGKFENDGMSVIEAIDKGSFQAISGEIVLFNRLQLQVNYRPLTKNKELLGWIVSFIDVCEYKSLLGELNQKNNSLSDAYSMLLQHASVVEELTAARERNKMANEIHDSLGHSLSILVALLEVCKLGFPNDIKTAQEKTNEAYKVAQNSLKELRITVSSMFDTEFEGYNLLDKLESLKKGFESTGINVDLTVKGSLPDILNDETRKTIYCICREALTNSLKHGEATFVNIIIRFNENLVELFIFDNGKGTKEIIKGVGLNGMENRVNSLDGKIFFGSGGEKGFNIHAEIPTK